MVFVCDILLTTSGIDKWETIRQRKQKLIDEKNQNKNAYVTPTSIVTLHKIQPRG